MSTSLFEPYQLSDLNLANRMVMAPLTRNRASKTGEVLAMSVTYYQQRASAGLIITESAPISEQGVGYPNTPGIYTANQAASWRRVTDAVHAEGGRIFIQLQHCGRISHPSLLPNMAQPVAPSAIQPDGQAVTYTGMQDYVVPRALEVDEIADVVTQFQRAAELAKDAGFDGIEIHGANGYIIDQFLRDATNQRTDLYGGSRQNRMRLLNEILDAVFTVWPAGRVGVRLTPENSFNSMSDSAPQVHFEYFLEQLSSRGLAYVHVLEGDMMSKEAALDYAAMRSKYSGCYMANNGYDLTRAKAALMQDTADLIAFGVPFLANPDLVRRYQDGLILNQVDPATFYGGDETGYIDYPLYSEAAA